MLKWRAFLLLCFALMLSGAALRFSPIEASPVYQATFNVDDTSDVGDANPGDGNCDDGAGNCTLRAAVEEANNLVGDDTINLPAGTYLITSTLDIDESVTIIGTGDPVIDAQNLNGVRIFDVQGVANLEIQGTTLQNGNADIAEGGCIRSFNADSQVILQNVTVQGCTAGEGGGVWIFDGSLQITDSTITGNNAVNAGTGLGGAVVFIDDAGTANVVNITISNTTISDNTSDDSVAGIAVTLENDSTGSFNVMQLQNNDAPGAQGGGVITNNGTTTVLYSNSTIEGNDAGTSVGGLAIINVNLENMTIQNNTAVISTGGLLTNGIVQITDLNINNNSANGAGGIENLGGTLTITNSTIANNTALLSNGGGLSNAAGGILDISATTFSGNSAAAGNGGGIYNQSDNVNNTITNSTFSGNTAPAGSGGAIFNDNVPNPSVINLNHATLLGNTSPGGGIFNAAGSTMGVTNSIVTQSGAGGDCAGTGTYNNSNNLAGGGQCGAAADVTNISATLANNGGPTQTHALQAGSNAINAVTCVVATDQRGVTRPSPTGGQCDIGAVEFVSGTDLALLKGDAPDPVNAGAALAYTLTVENLAVSTSNATTIVLTDTLPVAVTFASANASNGGNCLHNGTNPGGTVTCTWAGPLTPGNSFTATINVNVDALAGGLITNTADVTAAEADPDLGNNQATQDTTVIPTDFADMGVTKTDAPDPVFAGNTLTYTVTVTNDVASTLGANNVQMTDVLPTAVSFVSAVPTGGGVCNHNGAPTGGTVTCTWAGPLAPNTSQTVDITVDVSAGAPAGLINNTVAVTAVENDPITANNNFTEQTQVVVPQVDLQLTKTDAPDPVLAGNNLTYTLTIENLAATSNTDATNITLIDTLPAQLTFISATPSGTGICGNVVNTVTCDWAGPLAPGGTESVTITASVDGAAQGNITNTATVGAVENDPNAANNTVNETTLVNQPGTADLELTKTDSPDPIVAGGTLIYTLTATNLNISAANATNVVVTDTLPAGVTFQTVTSAPTAGACAEAAGVVTCNFATLAIGASETVTITVTVNPATLGTITNSATVAATEPDPVTGNNNVSVNTTVQAPFADVSVTKTDAPDPVVAGNPLTYTLTVTNAAAPTSNVDATGVVVTDTLPAGVTFQTVTSAPTAGACTEAGGVVTCNFATLAIGASETITINVNVNPATTGNLSNTVNVTANETDPTPGNNSASATTAVQAPSADVSVTKTDNPAVVAPGGALTYTVTVTNAATSTVPATGVVVTDTLPAGVTFQTVTSAPTAGACAEAAGVVTCNFAALAIGASETITINVTAGAAGTVTNTVNVTANETDPNLTNNSDSEDTLIAVPAADLQLTKSDAPDPAIVGVNLIYTIVVQNLPASNIPAANVVVTDTLPAGVTFVGVTSTPTTGACSQAAGTVTCNFTSIAVGSTENITITIQPTAIGPLSNTASVTTTSPDPNLANNSSTADTTVLDPSAALDIAVVKQVDDPNTFETDTIVYTVRVTNNGPAAATGLQITDTFPVADLTYGIVTAPGGTTYDTGTGIWNIGSLPATAPNNTLLLTIQATVNAGTAGTDILNSATVTALGAGLADTNPANDQSSVNVHVTAPLTVTKQAIDVNGGALQIGDSIAWIICALNTDTAPASNVVIRDNLDGNFLNAPTTLNVGVLATCPSSLPIAGLSATANLPAGNLNLVVPVPGSVPSGQFGVLYFETTVKDPGMSKNPSAPAFAFAGLTALAGLFYVRRRKAAVLLLILLMLLAVPVNTLYAQDDVPTEEVEPEAPPPLPFTEPSTTPSVTPEPPTETEVPSETAVPIPGATETPVPTDTFIPTAIPVETLPSGNIDPTPDAEGWMRYEMGDSRMVFTGLWELVVTESGDGNLSTSEAGAALVADFAGQSIRITYLRSSSAGIFEVYIDDVLVGAIDTYSEETVIETSQVFEVQPGLHRLEVVNTALSNPESEGIALELDYLEIQGVLLEPVPPTPTLAVEEATETPTEVVTLTETPTAAPVETLTPTSTVEVTIVEPTPTPDGFIDDTEPLQDGWTRYEMSHADIQLLGNWNPVVSEFVSGGSYIYSTNANAAVELVFEGEAIRFDYLQFWNFGIFEVYIDGVLVMSMDGYSPESRLGTSAEFIVQPGTHTLRIQNTGQTSEVSEGIVIALDAIDVKTPAAAEVTPTVTPEPAEEGWTRYEMSHPSFTFEGAWESLESEFVSGGSYVYSEEEDSAVTLEFTGDSIRVNYLKFFNFGIFEVYIDGERVATVDGYSVESQGAATDRFAVEPGTHTLQILNTGRSNAESSGIGVALDSVDVREIELPTSTPTPEPAASITGFVWMDADGDGAISDGDEPAAGFTLNLYADDGDVVFDADTDTLTAALVVEDGAYEFADLTPGIYWVDAPDSTNPDWEALMVVAPGEADILEPIPTEETSGVEGEISGRVFNDNNANREWSGPGESGIRNAKVYVYLDNGDEVFDQNTDTLIDSVQVKADGSYNFAELPAGAYWVWLDENSLPANYMDTIATGNHGSQNPKLLVIEETTEETPIPEAEGPAVTITTEQEGDQTTVIVEDANFAYTLDTDGDTSPDSIEGSGDRDNDGIPNYLDAFDPNGVVYSVDAASNGNALAGVQLRLVWDNGGVLTPADTVQANPQTTGGDGGYRFDIVSGTTNGVQGTPRTFILEILALPSASYTFPSAIFPPEPTAFDASPTAGSGQITSFSRPPNAGDPATEHDFYMSFIIQQGDDPVVNNHIAVDVAALPPSVLNVNNSASATRSGNPNTFNSPPVGLLLNSNLGMTLVPNNSSTESAGATVTYTHTFTNTSTAQSDRIVFSLPTGSQTTWTRQLRILRGTTTLATVSAGGSSAPITVAPGESLILEHVVTIPIGTANGTVNTSIITATSQEATQVGATLSRTVTDVTLVQSGCLQGTLFHDVNNNGVRDANEPVFPNVRVIVTNTAGATVATLTTDANGGYSLGGIPAGIYTVRIDATSIQGGAPVFLNPTTGQAQLNVAVGGACVVGNFSMSIVDPAITKIGSVSQALPGEVVTFTINLTNPSSTAITNVTVVDPLNGLLVFNSATSTQGTSTFNSTNNTVTFNLGTVAGNATVTMTVTVTVSTLATPGTQINNTATLNYTEGPAETSPIATLTIPSPTTPTPTATATTTGGATNGTQSQAAQGGGGGGADTLPQTGYRPLPANTNLLFGLELASLSTMEITLMLLALVILLACITWGVAQWLAENRSDRLARFFPNRPTRQLVQAVVAIAVVSSMVLSMVFATNLTQKSEKKPHLPEVADVSTFADIQPETTLPINWSEGGFQFAPPEVPASRIIIPRLGIDTELVSAPVVGTTWDVTELYDEVAHLDGTAYPGTMGNAVLAGHVQHQKGLGPFRNLSQLSKGDLIIAQGEDVEYTYIITDIMDVDPHAIEVTYPSNQPLLTLISCTRWDNDSWSYKGRLVVRAQFKSWRNTASEERQPTGTWRRYEVDGRDIHLDEDNDWEKVSSVFTSGGSYAYSRDDNAEINLSFTGEKIRIHYLYFWEFGMFDVYIDDKKVDTIDAYNPVSFVGSSDIYFLEPGRHKLRIVNTGQRNESAKGNVIALDAVDVYRADEE
ncbi:MAG: sortase [Anaerolineae bacterium]|nr:sortase [Anaerolineae bacterium]